jgi:hypothetical protein
MPTEPPIACSLSAPELATREADVAELGRAALIDVRRERAHAELRFAAGDGVRERVEAFVAGESECCAFLTMRVADDRGAVLLTIDAPADAELVLAELVEAFGFVPGPIR